MTYLIALDDPQALDAGRVGQKFRSLARAAQAGFPVPGAVAVSTSAHRHFLLQGQWPERLLEEIQQAAERLGLSQGLSIRSSAVREDLDQQSFAGQYSTFLRVLDAAELRERIEQVWQSADAETVQSYLRARRQAAEKNGNPLMGVVIQRMVDAAAAGVAFGRNPLRPARNEIVIEAVAGSAERLVNGELSPHRAHVGPDRSVQFDPAVPAAQTPAADPAPLNPDQWLQIADLLVALQQSMGEKPLDVEWALDARQRLWLLQFRRITTLAESDLDIPAGTWTRRIADDLWADRLTPFLADVMVRNASRFDMSRICAMLKIPVEQPTLTVIRGYLYVNCENLQRLVTRIPPRWRTRDLRTFFPEEFPFERLPAPKMPEMIRTVLRGFTLLVREPAVNPLVCLQRIGRNRRRIERRFQRQQTLSGQSPAEALQKVRFSLETLARIQQDNQWPYFHANLFTVMLRWLMVDCCGFTHAHFLQQISRGADNVSIHIERRFREMAVRIRNNPSLLRAFQRRAASALPEQLPDSFREEFEAFLADYGCRSRHRTLFVPRWSEAPEEVLGILQALVQRSGEPDGKPDSGDLPEPLPAETPAALSSAPWWAMLVLPAMRGLARRFLDLREALRFLLDRCLCEIRRNLLAFGRLTGLGENGLFLTLAELQHMVDGQLSPEEAGRKAQDRRQAFLEPVEVSTFYIDGHPVEDFAIDEKVFRGTGTSPGRISGRARIVTDPSHIDIQKGDIIVAENTDPGWTPILSTASGLVAEEGGLLNHCSIVARELKIPAVVGIRGATRRIAEGARLTIDGGLGLVRVEAEEAETRDRQSTAF